MDPQSLLTAPTKIPVGRQLVHRRTTSSVLSAPDEIVLEAHHRLASSPYGDLRYVCCSSEDDRLLLRGRVRSYYLKQLAQEIVRKIDGVCAIVNQLEVVTSTRDKR